MPEVEREVVGPQVNPAITVAKSHIEVKQMLCQLGWESQSKRRRGRFETIWRILSGVGWSVSPRSEEIGVFLGVGA